MQLTEDAFRALGRSSPWRWSTLHFTYVDDRHSVEAWLRRPGQLLVRRAGHGDVTIDERERNGRRTPSRVLLSRGAPGGPAAVPQVFWPSEVEPVRRPDGLVAERPSDFEVEYDDPMYQSYRWVAALDPVELSRHTTVTSLRDEDRLGRRTWWARMRPEEGYEPRCGCCPLLWSFISDRDENDYGDDPQPWSPPAGTVYPEAYDVALDVQTGVVVELSPVGPSSIPAWHRLEILEVDGELDGLLPAPRRRFLRLI
jgi:hypothetical protein